MMFARCPACQTVFRVRPEQLRAHHGRVRCGHCYAPFDALEHLQDDGRTPVARADDAVDTRAQPSAATPPESHSEPAREPGSKPATAPEENDPLAFGLIDEALPPRTPEPAKPAPHPSSFDLLSDRLEFEIPDGLLAPRKAPGERPPTDTPAAASAVTESDAADPDNAFPAFVDMSDLSPPTNDTERLSETDDERPAYPDAPPADWPTPAQFDARFKTRADANAFAAADAIDDSHDDSRPESRDTEQPAPTTDIEGDNQRESGFHSSLATDLAPQTDFDRSTVDDAGEATRTAEEHTENDHGELERLDATYGPAPGSRKTHWLWGLGAGLLLGTLAAQSAYLFREELARHWPALRPALLAACEQFGCDVPLSRVAGAISIETSDLQVLPRNPGRFVLNATVRNRAAYPQAFPHLELTLTDVQDRPAVRRVLTPEEWLPAATQARELFDANAEIALKLPFEARSVDAVGYRLYAFYP